MGLDDDEVPLAGGNVGGAVNLIRAGEPGRSRESLAGRAERIPAIDRRLA